MHGGKAGGRSEADAAGGALVRWPGPPEVRGPALRAPADDSVAAPAQAGGRRVARDGRGGSISRWVIAVREPADGLGRSRARFAQEVGQMIVLRPALRALVLHAQEDRQAAQRRVAGRRVGVAHRAAIFAEGDVAAVVLAAFDRRPMFAHRREQLVRRRLRGGAAGEAEDDGDRRRGRVGRIPDVALDAQELRRAGETRGERVRRDNPDTPPLTPPMVLAERLGVGVRGGVGARLRRAERRGKNRPAVCFGRGLRAWAGCLWPGRDSRRLSRRGGTARARAGSARHRR